MFDGKWGVFTGGEDDGGMNKEPRYGGGGGGSQGGDGLKGPMIFLGIVVLVAVVIWVLG